MAVWRSGKVYTTLSRGLAPQATGFPAPWIQIPQQMLSNFISYASEESRNLTSSTISSVTCQGLWGIPFSRGSVNTINECSLLFTWNVFLLLDPLFQNRVIDLLIEGNLLAMVSLMLLHKMYVTFHVRLSLFRSDFYHAMDEELYSLRTARHIITFPFKNRLYQYDPDDLPEVNSFGLLWCFWTIFT